MRYRSQQRIRDFPPAIATILFMLVVFCLMVKTLRSDERYKAFWSTQIRADNPTVITTITSTVEPKNKQSETEKYASMNFSADDKEILLKIAMAEAESEDVKGKALIMLVVLNRVCDDKFPSTIDEVVFQKSQFSTTIKGGRYWTTEPDGECYKALQMVMSGWNESDGVLYFESCNGDSWHSRNLDLVFEYGNHKFYK